MAKNERTRTMVYSNVNKKKKADNKSAYKNDDVIDLDNEIVIGLARFPEPEETKNKKKNKKSKKDELLKDDLKKENSKKNNLKKDDLKKDNSKKELIDERKTNKKNRKVQSKIRKTKIKLIKKIFTFLFFCVLLIGGFTYFLISPVFNIKYIEVINNQNITKEQIINSSGITVNNNMFKISIKEAENKLLENSYIESVDITRKPFDKIQIDIKERIATLMLEYGNSYVYINNQGYILEISTLKLQAPILAGYVTPLDQIVPGNRLNKEDLERLKVVLNIMESANTNGIDNLISKIDIKSKKDFILTIESEDKIVYLGECLDLSTQMLFVREMLEREKGIEGEFFVNMDLNTSNPVFREKV